MKPKEIPQVKYHPSISEKNKGSNTTPRRCNSADESRGSVSSNSSFTGDSGNGSDSPNTCANTSIDSTPPKGFRTSSSSPATSPSSSSPATSPTQSSPGGVADDGEADVDLTKSIQLNEMAADDQRLTQALRRVHKAEFEDAREDYDLALELYQVAIGQLLPVLQVEPKGPRRELLSSEIQRYMSRAEVLKRYQEVRRIRWQQDRLNEEMQSKSLKEGCSIQ